MFCAGLFDPKAGWMLEQPSAFPPLLWWDPLVQEQPTPLSHSHTAQAWVAAPGPFQVVFIFFFIWVLCFFLC